MRDIKIVPWLWQAEFWAQISAWKSAQCIAKVVWLVEATDVFELWKTYREKDKAKLFLKYVSERGLKIKSQLQ